MLLPPIKNKCRCIIYFIDLVCLTLQKYASQRCLELDRWTGWPASANGTRHPRKIEANLMAPWMEQTARRSPRELGRGKQLPRAQANSWRRTHHPAVSAVPQSTSPRRRRSGREQGNTRSAGDRPPLGSKGSRSRAEKAYASSLPEFPPFPGYLSRVLRFCRAHSGNSDCQQQQY
jgi:hypothetical protein